MEWLNSGAIGEVRMLTAELGFRTDWKPECLLLNPQFGGGALLSMGVYPVSFASMVFNSQPTSISTISYIGQTSVDEQSMALFNYEGGKMASLMSAIRTQTTTNGYIYGTDGYIYMPKFFAPRSAELFVSGSEPVHYEPEFLSTGYNYEAAEVGFCLRNGKTESCVMPLCESVAIMHTMDNIRKQWNFKYPFE
jgi:predicted dehydrogenase